MDKELSDWLVNTVNSNESNTLTLKDQKEETPYGIRMQAISDDGPGIISDIYEVTTGQKRQFFNSKNIYLYLDIPLKINLRILKPELQNETIIDPKEPISFDCIVEGRPKPSVFYTWLPFNDSASGEVNFFKLIFCYYV